MGVKRLNQKIGPGPIGRVFGFYIKMVNTSITVNSLRN